MAESQATGAPSGRVARRHMVAAELLPVLDAFPELVLTDEILPVIRAGAASMVPPPLSAAQQSVDREERFVPGPAGAPDVRVLVYTPPKTKAGPAGAYLQLHGGGFVIGAPEMNDGANRKLAADLGCVIVSVDYRLAPETLFPGAVEDAYAALRWVARNADALGVDPARIALGGQSAGGGHAASLALLARDRGEIPICLQVLDAPMLDDRTGSTGDPHPHNGNFSWTAASNRFGWRALLGMEPGGADVPAQAVPARAADLSGLPPTFIAVGSLDLFLDEDLEYARRLARAGTPTELHVIPGAFHGFSSGGADVPQVRMLYDLQCRAMARAFSAVAR